MNQNEKSHFTFNFTGKSIFFLLCFQNKNQLRLVESAFSDLFFITSFHLLLIRLKSIADEVLNIFILWKFLPFARDQLVLKCLLEFDLMAKYLTRLLQSAFGGRLH